MARLVLKNEYISIVSSLHEKRGQSSSSFLNAFLLLAIPDVRRLLISLPFVICPKTNFELSIIYQKKRKEQNEDVLLLVKKEKWGLSVDDVQRAQKTISFDF
jgi:hypothetical protein